MHYVTFFLQQGSTLKGGFQKKWVDGFGPCSARVAEEIYPNTQLPAQPPAPPSPTAVSHMPQDNVALPRGVLSSPPPPSQWHRGQPAPALAPAKIAHTCVYMCGYLHIRKTQTHKPQGWIANQAPSLLQTNVTWSSTLLTSPSAFQKGAWVWYCFLGSLATCAYMQTGDFFQDSILSLRVSLNGWHRFGMLVCSTLTWSGVLPPNAHSQ